MPPGHPPTRSVRGSSRHRWAQAGWPAPVRPLPAQADRPRVEWDHQSRQGVRPDAAARTGGGGPPRDGRAPRDQDAAAPVNQGSPYDPWSKDELRKIAEADDL